jgi:hypothetical protein
MSPPTQDKTRKLREYLAPPKTRKLQECLLPPKTRQGNCKNVSSQPNPGHCKNVSSHPKQDTASMVPATQDQDTTSSPPPWLRCVLLPLQEAVMCPTPPTGCYDTLLMLRMMQCVLHHAEAVAQASIAKKADHHPPPQHEDVAHHLPHTVLPHPQAAVMCSPLPTGYCMIFAPAHMNLKVIFGAAGDADHPQEEKYHRQAWGGAGPLADSAEQADQQQVGSTDHNPPLPAADAGYNSNRWTRRAVRVFFSSFISGLSPQGVFPLNCFFPPTLLFIPQSSLSHTRNIHILVTVSTQAV